jgi:hypothetical protein
MEHSYIIIATLLGGLVFLALKLGKANREISELKLKVHSFNTGRILNQLNNLLLNAQEKNKPQPKLNSTTEKLLVLAAKSPNPHEASAAAMQACKRIHKELGYK